MYKYRYATAIGLLIIVGIVEMIPPKLLGSAVDGINQGTLTSETLWDTIWLYGGMTFGLYAVTYYWMYKLFGGAFLVERILRTRLMKHLLQMTPTFYERNRTGDLMARATNDLKSVAQTAGFGILILIDSSVFMLTIVVTMIFFTSWKLTLAALLPLPLIAVAIAFYGKRIHQRFTEAQNSFGKMNDHVLEAVSGVRVIRAYVQEKADQDRFGQMTDEVYSKNAAVARIDALFEPTIKILVGASYLIGLGFGAYLVFHQSLTIGELVTFNVYLGMLIWPMFAMGELINVMTRGSASLDRVNETLHYQADVKEHEEPIVAKGPGMIEFKNVTFRYPSSTVDNLTGVSFKLPRGATMGIVGRTGSGKSTLLKQLLREYPVAGTGEVKLAEISLDRLPLDQLYGWIGYVPQESMLFSKTVKENILFGSPEAGEKEIAHALRSASMDGDIAVLPEGLQTLVGEKGVALSGGQKQRVSLSRAMIADAEILILDDAMSAVDARTEKRIIDSIRTERAGKTTLIATHRLSAVQHAELILVMDEGKVVERGTHEELMANKGWYYEQYVRQQAESSLN